MSLFSWKLDKVKLYWEMICFSLLKPEILHELVDLITSEPSKDIDEAEQYKYPNLACELLTSDIPALNERLVSEEILNKLYNFLQNEPPLNPLLSSYFSRTLSILISRKSEQVSTVSWWRIVTRNYAVFRWYFDVYQM